MKSHLSACQLVILLFIVTSTQSAFGQFSFMRRFNMDQNNRFYCGVQTQDGGYAYLGRATYHANVIMRLDQQGNYVWKKDYNYTSGTSGDFYAMISTSDDGFLLLGSTTGVNGKAHAVRLDNLGDTIWSNRYLGANGSRLNSAVETDQGDFVIVGKSALGTYDEALFAKISGTGDTIWSRVFSTGPSDVELTDVIETSDDNFMAVGYGPRVNTNVGDAAVMVKFDTNGDTLWTRTFWPGQNRFAYSVAETEDGGYVLCGENNSNAPNYYKSGFLVRTDDNGNLLWSKQVEDSCSGLRLTDVIAHNDGSLSVFGHSDCDNYTAHRFLIKLDASGNELWTRRYNDIDGPYFASINYSMHVEMAEDNGYIMCGYAVVPSFANFYDMVAVKLDPLGYAGCNVDETSYTITPFMDSTNYPSVLFSLHPFQKTSAPIPLGTYTYDDTLWCSNEFPIVDLGPDSVLCAGDSTLLSVSGPGLIEWFDGSNDSSVMVNQPGTYWVTVTNNGIEYSDTVTFLSCAGLGELNKDLFTMFPNPSNGIVTIELRNKLYDASLSVYSISGKLILRRQLDESNLELNLNYLEKGCYLIELRKEDVRQLQRLVIE